MGKINFKDFAIVKQYIMDMTKRAEKIEQNYISLASNFAVISQNTKNQAVNLNFMGWWFVKSSANVSLQDIPTSPTDYNYADLIDQNGNSLPATIAGVIVQVLSESDRMVFVVGYTTSYVRLQSLGAGVSDAAPTNLLLLQYA